MLLSDKDIKVLIERGNIVRASQGSIKGEISHGVTSYGYDCRVGYDFKIFTPPPTAKHQMIIDPKHMSGDYMVDVNCDKILSDHVLIPPNSFALACTLETFRIPRDCLVLCIGKSTYARCGIIVNVTPLEPEWEGTITIEISNTTQLPAKIYAGEGIAQLIFLKADNVCELSYADKKGKYQGQKDITLARV